MKLADWLKGDPETIPPRPAMTPTEFGRRIGCPQPTIWRYANDERIPEPEIMARIVEATGGAVTPNDFYGIELPAQREPVAAQQ